MTYTISDNRNDREYNKFLAVQTGSLASVAVSIVGGSIFIGSVSASVDSVYVQSGDNLSITNTVTTTSVGAADPYLNIGLSHAVGSTVVWPAQAGSRIVVTDVICSTQSGAGENRVSLCIEGGDERVIAYLASNGGYVSNLSTPLRTIVGGSLTMTTSTVGSTTMSLAGYLE